MDQEAKDIVTPIDAAAEAAAAAAADGPAEPDERRRRFTRRSALKVGVAGAAGLAGAGALASVFLGPDAPSWTAAPSAEVFPGDAPTGELWQLWKQRGWAIEARHYRKLGKNIRCRLCPNNCLLADGDRGRCRNRVHIGGKLYTMVYGNPCSFHVDPIEKKPLFHFRPGTGIFSIATSGCGFRCLNCQNWDISQRKPEETKDPTGPAVRATLARLREGLTRREARRLSMMPDDVVAIAEGTGCPSIAYTYSEPTVFYEYMIDTARRAKAKGLHNVWVTCGYIHREPLEEFCEVLDAANVDLKSFEPATYEKLNSGKLQPILETLKTLKDHGVWFEVTNLVVPTYTDDFDMIRRMCDWLVKELGPGYPLHFSRFIPRHKLANLPPTPPDVLARARSIAKSAGLHHVYIGNLRGVGGSETTYCPHCKQIVVDRRGYVLQGINLRGNNCGSCGKPVEGVWKI